VWVIYVSFQPSLLEGIERQAQSRYLQQNSLHLKPYLHLQKLKKVNLSKKEKVRHKGVIFKRREKEIKKGKFMHLKLLDIYIIHKFISICFFCSGII
jgi:hypothetical protein